MEQKGLIGRIMAAGVIGLGLTGWPGGAIAQTAGNVEIELNKLEDRDGACRAYFVLQNGTDIAFAELTLDIVLFDKEGIIAKRLAVNGAPLAAGKTSVKLFDIDGLSCEAISRVLLNDVIACRDATAPREGCVDMLTLDSRLAVSFIK